MPLTGRARSARLRGSALLHTKGPVILHRAVPRGTARCRAAPVVLSILKGGVGPARYHL
uniref:Uncharacterized protein n=1 Tax=Romanomermis culicivorax TaxID=13658 RepID=A0A915J7W7_ROMCU